VEVERLQAEKKWSETNRARRRHRRGCAVHADFRSWSGAVLQRPTGHRCDSQADRGRGGQQQPSDSLHLLPALERVRQRLEPIRSRWWPTATTPREKQSWERSNECGLLRELGNPGGEQVGHGIHPDYRPNAFQYDEQCDEMICPEAADSTCDTQQRPVACRSRSMDRSRTTAAAARNGSIARPERDAETRATVSMRTEPDALRHITPRWRRRARKHSTNSARPSRSFRTRAQRQTEMGQLRCRGIAKAQTEARGLV